jgi:hypothetical protein
LIFILWARVNRFDGSLASDFLSSLYDLFFVSA